jgi:hypothetical protein
MFSGIDAERLIRYPELNISAPPQKKVKKPRNKASAKTFLYFDKKGLTQVSVFNERNKPILFKLFPPHSID